MTSQAQLASDLNAINDKLQKVGNESATLLQKITDLETALGNGGNLSSEAEAALAALKAQAQTLDDLVPDSDEGGLPTPQ